MVEKFKQEPCGQCGTPRSVVNGAWLRDVRKHAGLTLREFAERMKVSPAYICDIEKNRRNCLPAMRDGYECLQSFPEKNAWKQPTGRARRESKLTRIRRQA